MHKAVKTGNIGRVRRRGRFFCGCFMSGICGGRAGAGSDAAAKAANEVASYVRLHKKAMSEPPAKIKKLIA